MTNTNDRDVAADRVEALKKWEIELIGASIAVTPLMRSAYCDGWKARAAISSAVPDGGKGSVSDGAQNFACYLIDHCEGETVREESIQHWLVKMLRDPQYTAPQAEHVDGGKGERDAKDAERFRWLRARFTGFDFDWMADNDGENGKQVICFQIPEGMKIGRDIDAAIDDAIEKEPK